MNTYKEQIVLVFVVFILLSACESGTNLPSMVDLPLLTNNAQAISLLGDTLYSNANPGESATKKFNEAKAEHQKNPHDPDALIWFGRRTAYLGKYREAINIYTHGITLHPEDARNYRHRGHRYISIRELPKAIADLEYGAQLITGREDEIEPDGLPNSRNIPVSSLHSNIWYHLGLAYYLYNDMEQALRAYQKCRKVSNNPDNVVSSSHWLYMILRRLGREREAELVLDPIKKDMDIIENFAYHKLLLFYKGEVAIDSLVDGTIENSSNAALVYGIGNWYYYNGQPSEANRIYQQLINSDQWASFGYLAAEADLSRMEK